ncbi:hypothetical protein, partial [Paracraurococcus lichenis]
MAKASLGRPRTQRARTSSVQDVPFKTSESEKSMEHPAFIQALENLNVGELRRVIAFAEAR